MKFTKETLRRMLRTFAQSAISYVAVNLCVIDFNAGADIVTSALVGLAVSAVAAGVAAVMNLEKPVVDEAVQEEVPAEVTE